VNPPVVFATATSAALADDLARELGADRGRLLVETFPDQETGHRVDPAATPDLRRRDVVILGAAENDASYLELCDLLAGLRDHHPASLRAMVPYLYCSTQERPGPKREFTKALNRVRGLLAMHPDQITFFDLHAQGVKDAHDGRARVEHLSSEDLVVNLLKRRPGADRLVLVSPDAGRGEWVQSLARRLGVPYVIADKRRLSGDAVSMAHLGRQVEGRETLVFDDMCRKGTTLLTTAHLLLEAGARSVDAAFTHAVLPTHPDPAEDPEARLQASPIRAVLTTDSHPRARSIRSPKFTVTPLAPMLADYLRKCMG